MIPDSYRTRSPDAWEIHGEEGANIAVNKTTIISERGVIILAVVLAAALAAWAAARVSGLKDHIDANQLIAQNELQHYRDDFLKLDRQYRMTELKLDDWTVVAHRAGLQLPGDYTRGPQGALDAESFHINEEKDHGSRRNNPPAGSKTR